MTRRPKQQFWTKSSIQEEELQVLQNHKGPKLYTGQRDKIKVSFGRWKIDKQLVKKEHFERG